MATKSKNQSLDEIQLLKRLLALELFKMNISQAEIGKKLQMDLTAVNNFLKGIKRQQKTQ